MFPVPASRRPLHNPFPPPAGGGAEGGGGPAPPSSIWYPRRQDPLSRSATAPPARGSKLIKGLLHAGTCSFATRDPRQQILRAARAGPRVRRGLGFNHPMGLLRQSQGLLLACRVIRALTLEIDGVEAALFLGCFFPPPASGSLVFSGVGGSGAGSAADRFEALVMQRVVGHAVGHDVLPDLG